MAAVTMEAKNDELMDQTNTTADTKSGASTREPLWLCSVISKHPKKSFGISLGIHVSILGITGILFFAGYDIVPTNFTDVPLDLDKEEVFLRGEAWAHRNQNPTLIPATSEAADDSERSLVYEYVEIQYDSKSGRENILTPGNLKAIEQVEREIQELEGYSDNCLLGPGNICVPPKSITQFFDGTYAHIEPDLSDQSYSNISAVLHKASGNKLTASHLHFHMGKDSVIIESSAHSVITRSVFFLGYPRSDGNDKTTEDFLLGQFRTKLYELGKSGVKDMRFTFLSQLLYTEDINVQVLLDQALAIGSCAFIYGFICFQTRSFFIASFAIFSIITSFCGANMIYRIMFDYKYFGVFHVLSVFIILGIGADDVFVFYDTWRHTSFNHYPSLAHRLSDCYRKAASAMFVTSLTTMIAFFANALSPLLSVSTFGLFSGLLVFVNYLSVITYFPTVVTVYHVYWEHLPPCRCCCAQSSPSVSDMQENQSPNKTPTVMVRFFDGPYLKLISHKIAKWAILFGFAILISYSIYAATLLQPDREAVKIFKSDSNYGRATYNQINAFKPSSEDDVVSVYLVWGLKPQDRSSCHKSDFNYCVGETVWDDDFNLNPAHAQESLLRLCETLKNQSSGVHEKLRIRTNYITGGLEVGCFIENMYDFLKTEFNQQKYGNQIIDVIPAVPKDIGFLMRQNPQIYGDEHSHIFDRYFEVALGYWLSGGYNAGNPNLEAAHFHPLLGQTKDKFDTREMPTTGLFYGTRLRYAAIMVNTTLPFGNVGYQEGLPIMDEWERFMKSQLEQMPESMSKGFQCTPVGPPGHFIQNQWHWLFVQQSLVNGATQGIGIGIGLAFPVLVLATKNVIVGFLATLTIACITVSVLGLIPIAGWKIGVLESLNLSLVVGLAVDYVVHLAEGYHASPRLDRIGRVKDMLRNVGVSITSGAMTTLGASLFMLFAKILFFMQFGIFMFGTIGFSLLYSLGMFTVLLGIIGPQGEVGSITPIFRAISKRINMKKGSDVTCVKCTEKEFNEQ